MFLYNVYAYNVYEVDTYFLIILHIQLLLSTPPIFVRFCYYGWFCIASNIAVVLLIEGKRPQIIFLLHFIEFLSAIFLFYTTRIHAYTVNWLRKVAVSRNF